MTTSDAAESNVDDTFGVFYIGFIVSMIGYGFTFFQTYVYFSRYPKDIFIMKAAVAFLCLLNTASSALISQTAYYYLVTTFPLASAMVDATSAFCAENTLAAALILIVQLCYASRVWKLSKNVTVTSIIAIMCLVGFALTLAMTVMMVRNAGFVHLAASPNKAIVAVGQATVFFGALITFIALKLYSHGAHWSENIQPDDWFNKTIAIFFSQGCSATLVQLAYFVVFVATPTRVIWIPFHLMSSKLFINCLLSLLNSRQAHHGHGINHEDSSISQHKSTIGGPGKPGVHFNVADTQPPINIEVSRTVEQDVTVNKSTFDSDETHFDIHEISKDAKGYAV
ncbi:uncharacterized protein EV420DRAFT_1517030 [Desarmillaria tabescens]|uniref:DUF6534 domain-containing protein n=1 Tax=Armillaria tabescens TaxID=1929756 RepID=A0AA39NFA5_ARMTA|nr:uncharacterized protein EV420DRAFT_1517030 [Desarmillaria tabescens]KAK0464582.1 hypothetical protein EV420DRAFT_1517030 [Desarmillaria tabescens]